MFDIHQPVMDAERDSDEAVGEEYAEGLTVAFSESPEGVAVAEYHGDIGWSHSFLHFGLAYLGITPPKMSPGDVAEILFELFPRKVSVEPDAAGEIIAELRAFWEFLDREYELPGAPAVVNSLDRDAQERLKAELSDSANGGMARSSLMMGQDAGCDMSSDAE